MNELPFRNLTREEAVQFLLGLPPGKEMELVTQRKQDSECVGVRGVHLRAAGPFPCPWGVPVLSQVLPMCPEVDPNAAGSLPVSPGVTPHVCSPHHRHSLGKRSGPPRGLPGCPSPQHSSLSEDGPVPRG